MRRLALLLACLCVLPLMAKADGFPALHDVVDVASDDVLNIRSGPTASAEIIGTLAPDARNVEVTGTDESGTWGRVNTNERSGWASLRFLRPVENGHWTDPAATLRCFGTEPFWSLTLSPKTKRAEYVRPGTDPLPLEISQLLAAAPGYPPATWALFKGDLLQWAKLRRASCSDGMSDRAYGIAIDLAVSEVRHDPLTLPQSERRGCCSVIPD